jgi:tRNA U55 pseudouridine synthase TruB
VRVLAADLGTRLGGVAHLRRLRRLSVGSFTDSEAVALDLVSRETLKACLELVRDLPRVDPSGPLVAALSHGRVVERAQLGVAGDGPWAVVGSDGELAAVCVARGRDRARPAVVLHAAS